MSNFLSGNRVGMLRQADISTVCHSKSHCLVLRSCNVQQLRPPGAGPSTASVCSILYMDLSWIGHINLSLVCLWFLGIWQWWKTHMFPVKILVDTFLLCRLSSSVTLCSWISIYNTFREKHVLGQLCPQWNCLMKWALVTTQEAAYALITAHEVSISLRSLMRFFWGAKIIIFHFLVALLIGVKIAHPFHWPWNNAPRLFLLWGRKWDVFWPVVS